MPGGPSHSKRTSFWVSTLHTVEGVLAVLVAVVGLHKLQANFATAGFLQLLIVFVVALRGGFWAATWTSVTANLCLNYFFVPPLFRFSVNDPENWVALVVFEISAILISHLSARSREQTTRAARSQKEWERLYRVSWRLLVLPRDTTLPTQIASLLRDVLNARTVVLFDLGARQLHSVGETDAFFDSEVRAACLLQESIHSAKADTVIRLLSLGSIKLGSLGIRGSSMPSATADAVAHLVAIAMERVRESSLETTDVANHGHRRISLRNVSGPPNGSR